MCKFLLSVIFLMSTWLVHTQPVSFRTYMNPVIPGDHPDCTLTKVGKDFYTTGSSFNPTPVIYHSTDLVHWEVVAQTVSASWTGYGDTPGGGCWGGQLVFYNGKYWDFFSRANTMYYVKADQPAGPWSAPVKVNNPSTLPYGLGYDNSVFVDDNNLWYLVIKNGQANNGIVELGPTGQPTGVVYDLKWLNPGPSYPYSWAEGPVMWKYGGYYYYSFARDVAGGQKVMRSRTLTADQTAWVMMGDFFNESDPLKPGSLFTGPNHASQAILLDDSTSWAGTRQGLYVQGSQNAWFDHYIYRDAWTPILAECPANQWGTTRTNAGDGISVLDNIHPNDWAMYAGVEFGLAPFLAASAVQKENPPGLVIYPNPAGRKVTIRSAFLFNATEIFDVHGQRILMYRHGRSDNRSMDLNLQTGVYLLKISGGNEFAIEKLIVN